MLVCGLIGLSCAKSETDRIPKTTDIAPPSVTVARLHELAVSGTSLFLLDVRTESEYRDAHLSFSDTLIPYDLLDAHLDAIPTPKDSPVYCFCRTGRRSGIATSYLRSVGYTRVYNVEGGMVAWLQAGYETVSGP